MNIARNRCLRAGSSVAMAAAALLCIVFSPAADDRSLLIVRGNGREFQNFVKGFSDELRDEFTIEQTIVDSLLTVENLAATIATVKPVMVILLDNKAIALYRNYCKSAKGATPPVLAAMGVFIEKAIDGIPNASGIAYEIPVVTSVVSLRSILDVPVRRIGIVHRGVMKEFVSKEAQYCARENIELVPAEISDRNRVSPRMIRRSLKLLLERRKVDALWVPNDIVLLRPEIIRDVWGPLSRQHNIPVIVGVESLVNPQLEFGTLSVTPDHVALGTQAAQIVLDSRDSGWHFEKSGVDRPLSIYKVINMKLARKFAKGRINSSSIDKVME